MSVRGPDSTGSTPRKRHGYSGISRAPAWSAGSLLAIVLAFVAVALVIWFVTAGKSGGYRVPITLSITM
jgi:hypothetical protein